MNFARLRSARGKSFLLIILNLPTVLFFLVILLDLLLLLLFLLVFRLLTRLARVFLSFLLLFLLIRSFGVACRTTETNARQSLKSESETKTRKRRERVERTESNSIRSVHITSRRTNERTNVPGIGRGIGVFGSFKSGKISGLLDGTARTYSSGKSKTDPSSSSVCGSGALRNAIAVPVRRAPTDKTAGCENLNPPAAARIILSRPAREISRRRVAGIDVIDVVVIIVIVIVVGIVGASSSGSSAASSTADVGQSVSQVRLLKGKKVLALRTMFRHSSTNERTHRTNAPVWNAATHGESGRR